ncbi:DUF2812 domain-containing protein [Terrisporobacter mayombei]|uniref:DUF2812 domain-containing protein n=1 Tax=Terrisporobacter mayombei TaxID=1541 RepID=A0ABY9PYK2_9FIRM|nr:DUF2812 domain-containing protein [Terrisporobacter mayombei]MCC3868275.1 DUF2812 domain-containing protein [Terrisporobacter mayombei]WMT80416.1 hypothetical protein TEMA_07320 [Terrisporobacter mayombei]
MKIGKDTFIKLILFKENECKALQEYLEEKALEGWILEDRNAGFFVFKKGEPRKIKYTVDIFTELKTGEYKEYCEASGWKYICETDKYLIFSSEEENITPVHTYEETELKKVRKSMIVNLFTFLCCLYLIGSNVYDAFVPNWGNNIESYDDEYLLLIMVSVIFVTWPVVDLVRTGLWYFKSSKCIKINGDVKYPTLKEFKIKTAYFDLVLITLSILIIILIGSFTDLDTMLGTVLIILAVIFYLEKIIKIIIN